MSEMHFSDITVHLNDPSRAVAFSEAVARNVEKFSPAIFEYVKASRYEGVTHDNKALVRDTAREVLGAFKDYGYDLYWLSRDYEFGTEGDRSRVSISVNAYPGNDTSLHFQVRMHAASSLDADRMTSEMLRVISAVASSARFRDFVKDVTPPDRRSRVTEDRVARVTASPLPPTQHGPRSALVGLWRRRHDEIIVGGISGIVVGLVVAGLSFLLGWSS